MENNKKGALVVVQLPTEILEDILSRLRVKDLIRFKSVCKTWLHVISSQHFIQQHFNKSIFRAIHHKGFVFSPCTHSIPPMENVRRDPVMEFVGSCDGLVCSYSRTHGIIHVSNPAIRKTACIPTKRPLYLITCFWFGRADDQDDEYNLVIGNTSHMHLIRPCIDSGSWKSTQRIPKSYGYLERIGTLYNGIVHWPVNEYTLSSCTILSYYLRQETIGEIPAPPVIRQTDIAFTIGEIDGCLSAMLQNRKDYEVWEMKEYGVRESWTKLMILPFLYVCDLRHKVFSVDEPEMVLDNPATVRSPVYSKTRYVESLVSPRRSDIAGAIRHA